MTVAGLVAVAVAVGTGAGTAGVVAVREVDGEDDGAGDGWLGSAVSVDAVAGLGDSLADGVGCGSVAAAGPGSGPAISDSARTSGPKLRTRRRVD